LEFGLTQRRVVLASLLAACLPNGSAAVWSRHANAAVVPDAQADRIIVVKSDRRLYLVRSGQVLQSFRVALGRVPKGTKLYQGDGRTPEGVYSLAAFNSDSRFYRSILVSYPNADDRARALALGQAAGGDVMIHGLAPERRAYGSEHWRFDWTNGCIAVTDQEIDEIWRRVEVGTPIEIRP
jgi:murein L,D-transpeptidase YafK